MDAQKTIQSNLLAEIDRHSREMISKVDTYDSEISMLKSRYATKKEELRILEESSRRRTELLNENNLKKKDIESQIAILKMNLQMQVSNYQMKVERRETLKKHLQDIEKGKELVQGEGGPEKTNIGFIRELVSKSVLLQKQEIEERNLHKKQI